jgi:hypothetical protein
MSAATLPELPLAAWEGTKETLHLYAQIVGKVRMATAAPANHWWHAALYVDVHGLTTRRLHRNGVTFQIDLDLRDHVVRVHAMDGREASFALHDGLSVAEFDRSLHVALDRLGVDLEILERPYGVPATTPFPEDQEHASYDAEYAGRFWHVLEWADTVLGEFAGWYCGKTSPVHLFWHSFDLALTRFSGRRATAAPGADRVTREAYSHELVSFGFWPGDPTVHEPTFYSYTAPEPPGLTGHRLQPPGARWTELYGGHMAVLPYEAVRVADDPRRALLAFVQSAYDAGSSAADWDREGLISSSCPPQAHLEALLMSPGSQD